MIQKIHSKKPVFTAKLFTVNELEIEVKPGVIHTHHNVVRTDSVIVLPVTSENEVYLVSQYRYNQERVVLECMAGYVDGEEDPLTAAKRELKEETGLRGESWTAFPMLEMGASSFQGKVYTFVVKDLSQGETHFDEAEDITTVKMPLSEAVKKIESGEINMTNSMTLILRAALLQKEGRL